MKIKAYKRADGTVGIRNKYLIIAVDECCEGICRSIERACDDVVVLTNTYTCMLGGNEETFNQLIAVGQHPNVAGVLILAMGCGSIAVEQVAKPIADTCKKPVESLVCQENQGTKSTIEKGIAIIKKMQEEAKNLVREDVDISELIVGVKCGGSDTSSGMASNPAVGKAVDSLVDLGAIAIGGELFELLGCEENIAKRAVSKEVADKILTLIDNECKRWSVEGTAVETMSVGNSVGGLTTIEEKSLGALYKMGTKPIQDILQINDKFIDKPKKKGFYLSEVSMLCGGAGVNFASLGAHIILWTSGAAGFNNPLVPVIRVSGNPDLYNADMDIDARGIMQGTAGLEEVSTAIIEKIVQVASGEKTAIEGYGEASMSLCQKDQRVEKLLNAPKCAQVA